MEQRKLTFEEAYSLNVALVSLSNLENHEEYSKKFKFEDIKRIVTNINKLKQVVEDYNEKVKILERRYKKVKIESDPEKLFDDNGKPAKIFNGYYFEDEPSYVEYQTEFKKFLKEETELETTDLKTINIKSLFEKKVPISPLLYSALSVIDEE